jgi:hypothetical protein
VAGHRNGWAVPPLRRPAPRQFIGLSLGFSPGWDWFAAGEQLAVLAAVYLRPRWSLSATVRNYLSSAISKVGGHNRIDAIRLARQNAWL